MSRPASFRPSHINSLRPRVAISPFSKVRTERPARSITRFPDRDGEGNSGSQVILIEKPPGLHDSNPGGIFRSTIEFYFNMIIFRVSLNSGVTNW